MYNSTKKFTTKAIHNSVTIQRDKNGIPQISASNREDLCFGIGYAHAHDRLVQLLLVRAIAQGRASEKFAGTDDLIEVDKFMRWIHFEKDTEAEMEKLAPDIRVELDAYCQGINAVISTGKRPLEFRMVGYHPEPWEPIDSLITAKIMGYIGLAQTQGDMEKFIIQMIQHDVDENKIRALFPYITEKIDYKLIKEIQLQPEVVPSHLWKGILPTFKASNNWVVSGKKTASGYAMLATDPHMDVNRLPALWYEMVWRLEDQTTMGITMPGLPAMVMGRTKNLAWGGTYGFMDMIDYFIEDCSEEKFRYDNQWIPFEKRVETIRPKKKDPITLTFYENHHGVLEGDPNKQGKYLSMAFSGRSGAGADIFNNLMHLDSIQTVKEAQATFRNLTMPTFNWVFADSEGNIGYQMNGRMPKRREGLSGLLPIPGWDSKNDWQRFEDPAKFPNCYNPESEFFATANNDLNKYGDVSPINICMAPYRVLRIIDRLNHSDDIDVEYMKRMHYDCYSKQAERLFSHIIPLLPDTENGNLLQNWNLTYSTDSKSATLFESVYENLIKIVFGKYGMGEEVIDHMLHHTSVFIDYFGNFDDVLTDENSPWFKDLDRNALFQEAVDRGLNVEAKPYGEIHKYDILNIFLGGKFPGFFGFDVKNVPMPGNRATISQGQIWTVAGRVNTFAPSFHMIAEMEKEHIWTNLPGGPSGNRFSKWYKSDLKNWIKGVYKKVVSF